MGFILITTVLASAYLLLQLFYLFHWRKTPELFVPDDFIPGAAFSVVVVARNEEKNIDQCIQGIFQQNYPRELFEIIVVNDRSTDGTVEKIQKLQSPLLRLFNLSDFVEFLHPPAFKKSAIELAVRQARYDWIIMTDADCSVPPDWLRIMAYAQFATEAVLLAAPVNYASSPSMMEKMQEMEQMVLMLITASGIHSGLHDMANGANMAFSKQAFLKVGGYEGNYQYASGDDMFLIEKMRSAFPDKISFVKSMKAVVETASKKYWASLLQQRIRWAGKNKGLRSPVIRMIWTLVGLIHFTIILLAVLAIFHVSSCWLLIVLLSLKWIGDFILMRQASAFFKKRVMLIYFIPVQVMYGFYILLLGVVMLNGKKSDW